MEIAQAVLIFFGLYTAYWLLYKYLAWRQSFIQPVATRVRFWVFLLIPICTINWLVIRLANVRIAAGLAPPWVAWLPRYCIFALLVIIVVETLLGLLFNYHYAVRRCRTVPQIIQSLIHGLIYLLIALLLLLDLFNMKVIAGVLIGSAVFLFGIGLLMQDALSNLFAGFSLEVSQLYKPGDWLTVGNHTGQVEATDWRALILRTADGDRIILPFSLLTKAEVVNHSATHVLHADVVPVVVDFRYAPARVEQVLLEAVSDIAGICASPPPAARLDTFEDRGIRYVVRYCIAAFSEGEAIRSAVHRAIWYHFRRAEIPIAYPSSDIYLHHPAPVDDTLDVRIGLLQQIAFLAVLTPEQMGQLAARLRLSLYADGEVICRQGDPGHTFYVISSGRTLVSASDDDGQEIFSRQLQVGDFFGEFSLVTGEPRTATVTAIGDTELLVVDKEDMRPALEANPRLAEHISVILAHRRHELQERRDQQPTLSAVPAAPRQSEDSLQREILHMIGNFFSY